MNVKELIIRLLEEDNDAIVYFKDYDTDKEIEVHDIERDNGITYKSVTLVNNEL